MERKRITKADNMSDIFDEMQHQKSIQDQAPRNVTP